LSASIVPYEDSAPPVGEASAERDTEDLKGFPHGMHTTQAETINAHLLAFLRM
jgi:non-heme chloroperoxidase